MNTVIEFPRYDFYKDSGVAWLGEIPSDWSLESIRSVTQLKSEKHQPELPVLSVYREYGVVPKDSRDDNHNATSLDTSNYKVVKEGDLVVNKMKAWQGSMGISEHKGIVSPAYITCRVDASKVYPKFLHYLLRSKPYIGVYNALSYGVRVGQWDMHYEDFKHIPLPLPSREQQNRIANFLDQKTVEIDEAIAKKQHLIELLKEQKAILINQAVTKGLNPDVPMRDSGVEWLGAVPAHWKIQRLKYVTYAISTGKTPPSNLPIDVFADGHFDWFTPGDFDETGYLADATRKVTDYPIKKNFITRYPQNSMYFIGIGSTLGKVAICNKEASCNQQINVLTFNQKMIPDYCMWLYQRWRETIFKLTNYTTMPILNQSSMKSLPVLVPPMDEQREIVEACKRVSESNEKSIMVVGKQVKQLVEFKQIIISSAVTGKIKI